MRVITDRGIRGHILFALSVMICARVMSPAATTVVLFDNFESGDRYNLNAGEILNCDLYQGNWMRAYEAVSFVPDRTAFLDRVDLAVSLVEGYNEVDIVIFADSGGLPGGTLETIHLSNKMPNKDGYLYAPVAATSTVRPELTGGKTYWIGVSPGAAQGKPSGHTKVFWHNNGVGTTQPSANNWTRNGSWFVAWTAGNYACTMRVVGGYSGCARPRSYLNGDCKVNLADLAILAEDWLKCGRENPADCG